MVFRELFTESKVPYPQTHEKEPDSKIAYLFPGQGTQYKGMGKSLAEQDPAVAQLYAEADEILGYPISEISFDDPDGLLEKTCNTQAAIFVYSYACLLHQQHHGRLTEVPTWIAGHSLGTYTGLVAAGAIGFAGGLEMVRARADGMQEACELNPSGMLAVSLKKPELVETAMKDFSLEPCTLNTSDQMVIGGLLKNLTQAQEWLKENGVNAKKLAVDGAFHTSLMAPAADDLAKAIKKVRIKPPEIAVIDNVTGEPIKPGQVAQALIDQLTKPVLWEKTITYLNKQQMCQALEFGDKGILSTMNRSLLGGSVEKATTENIVTGHIWNRSTPERIE